MERTKKADQTKNNGKTAKDDAQESEKVEEAQEAHQETGTAEEAQETHQETGAAEEAQEAHQEAGTAEEAQETHQETGAAEEAQEAHQETGAAEEAQEAQEAPQETAEQDEEAEPDMFDKLPNPCVYCGPSVKGIARQYTTYQGGIPDALRKFILEHPGALGLIVPTGTFPAMRRRLETHGTPEAELYKAVKAEL